MGKKVNISFEIDGVSGSVKDFNELNKVLSKVSDSQNDVNKELKESGKALSEQGKGAKKAGKGITKMGKLGKAAMTGLKGAIAATGIGLLIAAVAMLVDWFKKTDVGVKIISASMAVMKVIFDKIGDVVTFMGEAIQSAIDNPREAMDSVVETLEGMWSWYSEIYKFIYFNFLGMMLKLKESFLEGAIAAKAFFGGDTTELETSLKSTQDSIIEMNAKIAESGAKIVAPLKDAYEAASGFVAEMADEMESAISASNGLIDSMNKHRALINKLVVDNAELNKVLEEQKKISEDTTLSFEERKVALDKVIETNEKLAANALLEAQSNRDLIAQKLELTAIDEDRRDLLDELATANSELIKAEQDYGIVKIESARLFRELDKEEVDRKKSILQVIEDLELDAIDNEMERNLAAHDLALIRTLEELDLLKATEEEKQRVRDAFADKRIKLEEDTSEKTIDIEMKKSDKIAFIAQTSMSIISDIASMFMKDNEENAEKNFKIDKALGIASATINTAVAVSKALATTKGGPIIRGLAAAAAGAAGLAQIIAIKKTKFNSTNSLPSASKSQGPAPSINYQLGNQEVGGSIDPTQTGNETPPPVIKTYVLASDVTDAQQANFQIENLATL